MKTNNTLHIYGQNFQHEPVEIGGSYAALHELAEAIIEALAMDDCTSGVFYVNDGEGYTISITVVPDGNLSQLRVPYSNPDCREPKKTPRLYPSQMKESK